VPKASIFPQFIHKVKILYTFGKFRIVIPAKAVSRQDVFFQIRIFLRELGDTIEGSLSIIGAEAYGCSDMIYLHGTWIPAFAGMTKGREA
jgi:hypothetical protein